MRWASLFQNTFDYLLGFNPIPASIGTFTIPMSGDPLVESHS
jgi:hypothetical protein